MRVPLPDARPRSDRFRCAGRESKFLAVVREKLDAGAALVQVYTGFIYEGPAMIPRICRALARNAKGEA